MATQTLAEAAKLIDDQLVAGVAQDIISVNPIFSAMPFNSYTGQAIVVNRELALGDAGFYAVDATITHRTPSSTEPVTFTSTKLIGDAEMDGLVKAQSASAGVDQVAVEISSKAKSIGRKFQQGMATGTGVGAEMNSFHTMVDSSQYTTASTGQALSFELLDEGLDLVLSKDGEIDFIVMPKRTLRSYKALVRSLGGVDETMVYEMPDGTKRTVSKYEGIPIFRSDYLSTTETADGAALTGGALASIYCGVFDDGTTKVGVAGIHPQSSTAGIAVEPVGLSKDKDEEVWRIKQYANFASFNRRGLSRITSITN